MSAGEIEIRRRLAAPADQIFTWWTDPEKLARWMSPLGTAEAVVDLRVGGGFRVLMRGAGMEIEHTGRYLEIEERFGELARRIGIDGDELDLVLWSMKTGEVLK